jgi:lipopolysaccharide assembly outer membrane protein LptD (OstA)
MNITQENFNNKNILNEDSGTVFLNSQNLMSKKSVYGYDFIDEGLVLTYGSKASILHKPSTSNLGLFLGQRMKKTFTGEKELDFSGYFGKIEASLMETFKFNTDFIISEANELTYSKSTAQLSFGVVKTSLTNTFIDKSLLNNAKLNVNENQYTFTVKLNDEWSFNSTLIENRNFREKNGETSRKNVSSTFSLTLAKDCLTFIIGAKRERYTTEDYENKYKIYTSITLLGI